MAYTGSCSTKVDKKERQNTQTHINSHMKLLLKLFCKFVAIYPQFVLFVVMEWNYINGLPGSDLNFSKYINNGLPQ